MTRIKMSNSRFLLYKMGLNTCKNFQKWNFSKIVKNHLIHPESWKSVIQYFSPYKMGQNTCKNFQKWNFSKNAQNLLIYPENWKSQNQFFPIKNGSKKFDDKRWRRKSAWNRRKKKKRETKNACKLVFWRNDSQKMLVN